MTALMSLIRRATVRAALVFGALGVVPTLAFAQSNVSISANPTAVAPGATVTLNASITPAGLDCGYGCVVIGVQGYLQIYGSNGYFTSTTDPDGNGGLTLPGSDEGPGQTLQPVTYTASGGFHYDLCYYQPGWEFYGCVYGYGSADESGSANVGVAPAVAPSAVGVSPSGGSGTRQTFVFQYSSAAGEGDIGQTWQIFHPSGAGNQSCVVGWYRGGGGGIFVLWGDLGWQDQQSAAPNTSVVLENSQCRLHMVNTTVAGIGNNLTIVLDVSFKSSYVGTKAITMYGWSAGGGYGTPSVPGSYTVSSQTMTSGPVTPGTGNGMTQTFHASFASNFGPSDVREGFLLIGSGATSQTCWVAFEPGTPGWVHLWDDSGTSAQTGTIGSGPPLSNSQCTLSPAAMAPLSSNGDTWTVDFPVTFTSNYLGPRQIYAGLYAGSTWANAAWSGWQSQGAWTVGPRVTSVTPGSGAYATDTLDILGEGFGTTVGTSTVTINSVPATVTSSLDGHLQVTVPNGAASGPLVVTRAGVVSNAYGVTILQGPVIVSMTPTWGPETTIVSISGQNFGTVPGVIRTHAGEPAFHVEPGDWTPTHITATVPAGATSGLLTVADTEGHTSRGRPFTIDTEEVVYYHSDAIGSVRMVTGVEGVVIERHDFRPFGEELTSAPMQVGFVGSEKDRETESSSSLGLNYLGARHLFNASARFTGVDPNHVGGIIFDPQSWNGYAYAGNNPLRFVDPDGRQYHVSVNAPYPPPTPEQLAQEQNDATNQLIAGRLRFGFGDGPPPGLPCEYFRTDCNEPLLTPTQQKWFEAATLLASIIPVTQELVVGEEFLNLLRLGRAARAAETIGGTGKIGEAALSVLGGEGQVFFRTIKGARFVDRLAAGVANESKVGYVTLNKAVQLQIEKDASLLVNKEVTGVTWHFFKSPVTGAGGPSLPLVQELQNAGIRVVVH
jgi:RHS repeat-associated protein